MVMLPPRKLFAHLLSVPHKLGTLILTNTHESRGLPSNAEPLSVPVLARLHDFL